MKRRLLPIGSILLLFLFVACADGVLEVEPGSYGDVGIADDAGNDDDTGANDDAGDDTSCTPDDIECVGDDGYRQCEADGGETGQWSEPSDCPAGQRCAPWADDVDDICATCPDDRFAPDNFVSETAPLLDVGESLDALMLCDNENTALTSHNFFYLGETDAIDVELTWDDADGRLGLDIWSATSEGGDRTFHADAGQDPSQLHHAESLSAATHIYIRVFFRSDDKPSTGISYTLSRTN